MSNEVSENLEQFKEDLNVLSSLQVVRKHIISGECCALTQNQYFDLRSEIANCFELHPNEVLVVGSAKLGFSVAPNKRYCPFRDVSDIDVVLVSAKLFDEIWEYVFRYKKKGGDWPKYDDFVNYFFQGWIRPDKLPESDMFPFGKKWWNFFQAVTKSRMYGDYKITGAVYKSYFHLEDYQKNCVQQCIDEKNINNLEGQDGSTSE